MGKWQVISKVFQMYSRTRWELMQSHKNREMPCRLQFFCQFIDFTSGQIRTLLLLRSDRRMEISLPKVAGLILFFFFEASQSRKQCRVIQMSCRPCHLPTSRHLSCTLSSLAFGGWVAPPAAQTAMSVCILQN